VTLRADGYRDLPMLQVHNAREHGLAGDGVRNDQPALQELVDMLGAACAADGLPRVIYAPPGVYSIRDAGTAWRSGVSLIGAGAGATRFVLSNAGNPDDPVPLAFFTTQQHGASVANHIADVTFADFEVDGSAVQTPEYTVLAKGLGLQYVLRGRFRDLYIHDTGGTGFGCDFLQDTVVHGVVAERCGRMGKGDDPGGAGLGVGVGGWGDDERLTINACTATRNGMNGIFLELQKDTWPPPCGIAVTGCHVQHNRFGISDWGAQGLVVSACTIVGNLVAGFDVSSQGTTSVGGRGGIVSACLIDGNVGDGIVIGNTPGPYSFRGNRVSGNGRFGFHRADLEGGDQEATRDVVLHCNEIWGNALDGIRIGAAVIDQSIVDNRVRGNGRQCAPRASRGGDGVEYTETTVTDRAAHWACDGHRGKQVVADGQTAWVVANTETELLLLSFRPGAETAWRDGTPAAGAAYSLPDAPATRAGVAIAARTDGVTLRANRVWDSQGDKTQTHGLWIAARGACVDARVVDNDLLGNAQAAARFDAQPSGGLWERNLGLDA
jgi:hypothetical protein